MQKVLRKRIFRDFKENLPRYLALAFLLILSMYMVVSIVGAAETVMRGTTTEAKKQNVEDGQFSLFVPMKESEWDALTDKGITLEKMFFLDYDVDGDKTLRVFKNRTKIDTIAIHAGKLAQADDELVLERQYAEKNDIHVGDTIVLGDRTYKVSGIGTVPDYDSPLKSLGDTVCDSLNFGLAFVTDEAYTILQKEGKSEKSEEYYYAYKLNDAMTDDELKAELKQLSFSSDDVDDAYFQEYWDRTLGREEEFRDGINELADGAKELADGLSELTDNNHDLQKASDQIFAAYLEQANSKLSAYGVEILTADNFEEVLDKQIRSTNNAMLQLGLVNAKSELQKLKAFSDGIYEYTDGTADAADGAADVQDGVQELKDKTADMLDEIFNADANNLLSFVTAEDNVRIHAASDDVEMNNTIGMIAGVLLLVLIAYVLSVFVVHSIDQESAVIGALYALGVKRKDLMRHYILLPTLISLIGGAIGTALAYTKIGVRYQMQDTYYYYSLPDIAVQIRPYTIVYGVAIPPIICLVVTSLVIRKRLSRPVLTLLKNEQKAAKGKDVKLGNMKFMKLFRIRQILRERRTALTVVFGMFVSILLLVMSMEIYVYCRAVQDDYVADTKFEYMYTYKYPGEEVPDGGYEAYAKTLKKEIYGYNFDVTVLGIKENNPFFDVTLSDSADKVTISSSISYKYGLKKGDVITLKDEENGKIYAFEIEAVTQYAPSFMVFLPYDKALDLFGEQDDYYNVVFADHDLGVESGRLYSTMTRDDVKKAAGIFSDQMRSMIITIGAVSALIFAIVLYLMMKVMIDRSSFSIALIKIFGYRNKEVKKMYLDGNFYIVLLGALVSIPLAKVLLDAVYEPQFVPNIACGVDKSFSAWLYLAMFAGVLVLYFIINHLLVRKIKQMLPAEVLKNRE